MKFRILIFKGSIFVLQKCLPIVRVIGYPNGTSFCLSKGSISQGTLYVSKKEAFIPLKKILIDFPNGEIFYFSKKAFSKRDTMPLQRSLYALPKAQIKSLCHYASPMRANRQHLLKNPISPEIVTWIVPLL